MLHAMFLGNCGCCLFDGNAAILLDAPNGLHTVFDPVSDELFDTMLAKQPPFDLLCAAFFTHRHSDHYNKKRLRMLQDAFPELFVFSPSGATGSGGVFTADSFRVEYSAVHHSGAEFSDVPHVVYWISSGGKQIYFSGDSVWDKQTHLNIWNGRVPDAAIWNPNFINHPDSRELMQMCKTNILCHLPIVSEDVLGVGRKARSSAERYGETIPSLTCITEYPTTVEL